MNPLYPSYRADMKMEIGSFKKISLSTPPIEKNHKVNEIGIKKVYLKEGEELLLEPGTMLACRNVTVETEKAGKNLWEMVKRYLLGQEQLFVNRFKGNKDAWISFEEAMDEEIADISVKGGDSKVQITQGSFLASSPNILLSLKTKGIVQLLRSIYIEPIMFNVQSRDGKEGHLFFSSNNSQIKQIAIRPEDSPVYIDNYHLVATLGDLQIHKEDEGDNYLETLLSGEGAMCRFKGNGTVYLGSRVSNRHPFLVNVVMSLFEQILPYYFLAPIFGAYRLFTIYTNNHCVVLHPGRRLDIGTSDKKQCHALCKSHLFVLDNWMNVVTKNGRSVIECCCKVSKIASLFKK